MASNAIQQRQMGPSATEVSIVASSDWRELVARLTADNQALRRQVTAPLQKQDDEKKDSEPGAAVVDTAGARAPLSAALSRRVANPAVAAMRGMKGSRTLRTRMVTLASLSSSGSADCYAAAATYATVVALGEFTDFANVFDEFKVEEVRVHFIPFSPTKVEATVNTNGRSLIWAYDNTDSTVPTGMQVLWANATASVFSNFQTHRSTWKTSTSQPAVWYSTLSTTNPLQPLEGWKIAGDPNLGTSVSIGTVWVEYFVVFRARR
jgi:hypothetical protein